MKKLFTLLLSLSMVIAANAADKFAQGPISWSTGPWYDAATGGNPVSAPVAGDNVFPQNFKITVDVDATCDNYTLTTGVTGNLVINAGITLTVRGKIDAPAIVDVDLLSGSAADSKLKLTGEILPTNGTLGTGANPNVSTTELPLVFVITENMVKSIRPKNIEIALPTGTGIYTIGNVQASTFNCSAGKIAVLSGNLKIHSRINIGKVDGANEFLIASGATVYTRIIETDFVGKKFPGAKVVINGTLITVDKSSIRQLVMGETGTFKVVSGNATSGASDYLIWDGWWNNSTMTAGVPAPYGDYATPAKMTFGDNTTFEFNRTSAQNIQGTIPQNKVWYTGNGTSIPYAYLQSVVAGVGDSIVPSYKIPYANIKISGVGGVKTLRSNLIAKGNLDIVEGTFIVDAGKVAVIHGNVNNVGTLTVTGALINAKSADNAMGTVTSTISATNEVALVAVPKSGYQFVNWTEAPTGEISNTAALAAFTPADGTNRTLVANFSVSTGLSTTKANAFVTVEGSTIELHGDVNVVEVFDAQGRRIVSQANVTSVNVKGNGIYIVKMHTTQGVNTQKINVK